LVEKDENCFQRERLPLEPVLPQDKEDDIEILDD